MTFLFTGPTGTLHATGCDAAWRGVDQALHGLRHGSPIVVGALPFHASEPPALLTPRQFWFSPTPPTAPDGAAPTVVERTDHPSPEEHARRVREAVRAIKAGACEKIVLSRAVEYRCREEIDPRWLFSRFLAHSGTGHAHLTDLSSAGPPHAGTWLVGSSPELLLLKRGRYIESHPVAGTAPRCLDPVQDQAQATELLLSAKNNEEHSYVTREIRRVLQPWCTDLDVPERPSLTATSHTWHLGTRIRGMLRDDAPATALELAAALHPTPAVCGYPAAATRELLRDAEPHRGFYAGAVGWADEHGNGEWRVSIRGAVVRGATALAHAGGGIVADSDPEDEVRETEIKLGPVREALGVEE